MIPALILAAGSGRRMGGPKARLVLDGETLLQRTARIAQAAGCTPVIAVVGDWDPGALDPSVRVVRNPEATEGMASSIRRGIAALPGSAPAVLLLVIDQPAVEVSLLRRLLQLHIAQKEAVPVACAYGDSLGIPAILPARFFPELLTLEGDRGAKPILLRENALTIPFPEGAWDLDTPEDLAFTR
ncbi:MAG: nucleotidyltransferase family protein [Holophagaceae bacterium]|nr:nucleotidyltransferase family protein [Holophagaceae bacterium]